MKNSQFDRPPLRYKFKWWVLRWFNRITHRVRCNDCGKVFRDCDIKNIIAEDSDDIYFVCPYCEEPFMFCEYDFDAIEERIYR